jgi:hypothetical protein
MKIPSRMDRIFVRVASNGVIFMDTNGLNPLIRSVNHSFDITEIKANGDRSNGDSNVSRRHRVRITDEFVTGRTEKKSGSRCL